MLKHIANKNELRLLSIYSDIALSIITNEHFNVIEDYEYDNKEDRFVIYLIDTEIEKRNFRVDLVIENENIYKDIYINGNHFKRFIEQNNTILNKVRELYKEVKIS